MNTQIQVTKSSIPEFEEYVNEIKEIWQTHWLTNMGKKHEELSKKLKEYLHVPNIDLLVNGHMALEMVIQAMNLKGEVITTPFTFVSTTHAIVRNGLKPVFCDIDTETLTIDVSKIEALITDQTSAIIPVHVYGNICDVFEIERIAKKYGLKVIYDACHAFGEEYSDIGIGNFGDASIFSFHATKVYNSIEGGAVCHHDKRLQEILWDLKNFGIHDPEDVIAVGANAKMNEFSAAMGICNLRHIDEYIDGRRRVVERYCEHLAGIAGLRLKADQAKVKSNYCYFPVIFEEKIFGATRNEVFDKLAEAGINTRKYFYPLMNELGCYKGKSEKYDSKETPVALHISKRVLTLPLYPDLDFSDVDKICGIIKSCKK